MTVAAPGLSESAGLDSIDDGPYLGPGILLSTCLMSHFAFSVGLAPCLPWCCDTRGNDTQELCPARSEKKD